MLIYVTALIGLLVLISAGAIDLGYLLLTRSQLQDTADAAARYAADGLGEVSADGVRRRAIAVAAENVVAGKPLELAASDVELGRWSQSRRTFEPVGDVSQADAVRVRAPRTRRRNGGVPLFAARILGINELDMTCTSVTRRMRPVANIPFSRHGRPPEIVPDLANYGKALDLRVNQPENVLYDENGARGGLRFTGGPATVTGEPTAADKLARAVNASNAMAVHFRINEVDTKSSGYANPIEYGESGRTNFAVYQAGRRLGFRVRTSDDRNAQRVVITPEILPTGEFNVVMTHSDGKLRVVIRGQRMADFDQTYPVPGRLDWETGVPLTLGRGSEATRQFVGTLNHLAMYETAPAEKKIRELVGDLDSSHEHAVADVTLVR